MTTYSMAPPSAYQQPTSYTMTPTVSSSVLRLARLPTAPVPLPQTGTLRPPAPSIVYQPKSGLVPGSIPGGTIPGGGLIPIPIPGMEPAPDLPAEEEGLGDKIVGWWSHMPLSHKALTAGAVVAAGVGGWWLIWGRKKKATPNKRRGTVKHRGTVRKRRLARYKAYGSTWGSGGSVASVPPGRHLYRPRFSRKR